MTNTASSSYSEGPSPKLVVLETYLRANPFRAVLRGKRAVKALRSSILVEMLRQSPLLCGPSVTREIVFARVPRQRLQPSLNPVKNFRDLFHFNFLIHLRSLGIRHLWSRAAGLHTRLNGLIRTAFLTVSLATSGAICLASDAGAVPQNVFAQALIEGSATAPVPQRAGPMSRVLESLQAQSGSKEPISIVAARVVRFTQQARCGRIRFAMGQPLSKKLWPAMGGEMNVCEDGQPPLRVCPERPGVLVPANAVCASGKTPVDTPEVAAAIAAAIKAGDISHDQMIRDWAHKINAHGHAQLTQSASSPALPNQAGALK